MTNVTFKFEQTLTQSDVENIANSSEVYQAELNEAKEFNKELTKRQEIWDAQKEYFDTNPDNLSAEMVAAKLAVIGDRPAEMVVESPFEYGKKLIPKLFKGFRDDMNNKAGQYLANKMLNDMVKNKKVELDAGYSDEVVEG